MPTIWTETMYHRCESMHSTVGYKHYRKTVKCKQCNFSKLLVYVIFGISSLTISVRNKESYA